MADLEAVIDRLLEVQGSSKVAKKRRDDILKNVEDVATQEGLNPNQISSLVEYIVEDYDINTLLRCRVVRCLIPKSTVPCSAVLSLLSSLSALPLALQQLVFKWILLVFDLIDDRGLLHALYDGLFYYLQYDALRPLTCQLLCYLTNRKDVKEYRVHRLMEIHKQVFVLQDSSESALVALLAVYKMHCPQLVGLPFPKRRKVWFRQFEKTLAANILRIQGQRSLPILSHSQSKVASKFKVHMDEAAPPRLKKSRANTVTAIPSVTPSVREKADRVSVGQLTSVPELCDHIHKLELPGQMAAVLESPLLQHVFTMWPDPSAALRLTYWLQHSLGYELDNYSPGSPQSPQLLHMLRCLVKLSSFLMEPIPTVEDFLEVFMENWNGTDYQEEIFQLLGQLSLVPFEALHDCYLEPLKKLFLSSEDVLFKYKTLSTLTTLLRNWALFEWPRFQQRLEASCNIELVQPLGVFQVPPWKDEEPPDFDPILTLRLFVQYVESMLCITMEVENNHSLIQHATAGFYEVLTRLPEDYDIDLVAIPHPPLVYGTLLGLDAVSLNRILSSFLCCKDNFTKQHKTKRDLQMTHTFNSVVLDLCDALWRNLAFSNNKRQYPTLLFQLSREFLKECGVDSPNDKMSIVHHSAMMGFVRGFTRENNREGLQPSDILKNARLKKSYLNYLKQNHLTGLVNYITTFVRSK